MKKLLLLILTIFLTSTIIFAQEEDIIKRKVSVSLVYPVSSNGAVTNVENNASFNILFGVNSGVKGGELSVIGAYNKRNVTGFQFAGGFNITKGEVIGAQYGGLFNATNGNVSGVQVAGLINATNASSTGGQFAGLGNTTLGNQKGVTISAVNNFTKGNVYGGQISLTNIGMQRVEGIQLGLVNYADTLSGTQFGLINVTNNIERGTPIGLLNIVKDGYYALEVTSGDINVAGVSYKMGTTDFYTIFKYGYTPKTISEYTNHSYGLGFGTLRNLSKNGRHRLAIDVTVNQFEPYKNTQTSYSHNEVNIITKLDLSYQFSLTKNISLVGGPSLNWYHSQVQLQPDGKFGTIQPPSETLLFQDFNSNNTNAMWIGFNLGINYTF